MAEFRLFQGETFRMKFLQLIPRPGDDLHLLPYFTRRLVRLSLIFSRIILQTRRAKIITSVSWFRLMDSPWKPPDCIRSLNCCIIFLNILRLGKTHQRRLKYIVYIQYVQDIQIIFTIRNRYTSNIDLIIFTLSDVYVSYQSCR